MIPRYRGSAEQLKIWDELDREVQSSSRAVNPAQFASWVAHNFAATSSRQAIEVDTETCSVTLRQPLNSRFSGSPSSIKASSLLSSFIFRRLYFATANRFHEVFTRALFRESPREVTGEKKIATYNLSEESGKDARADYFISHSWEDVHGRGLPPADAGSDYSLADSKFAAISSVVLAFHGRKGRFPTLWLDKTCVNPDKSTDIEMLPISMAFCDKIIVVMSRSYLRRLWCIWELFSLFAFCNKEVAIARVVIVPLASEEELLEEMHAFKVDNAHCFDPNEEFKLRTIMHNIGQGRGAAVLNDIKQALITLLVRRINQKRRGTCTTALASLQCCRKPSSEPLTAHRDGVVRAVDAGWGRQILNWE